MIYSKDIDKICALCRYSKKVPGDEEHLKCTLNNSFMTLRSTCGSFIYDIFKKPTHRRRRLKTNYSADDFTL